MQLGMFQKVWEEYPARLQHVGAWSRGSAPGRRSEHRSRLAGCRVYDSAVSSSLTIRPARVEDVLQMARVIVASWQETYRGLSVGTRCLMTRLPGCSGAGFGLPR